VTWKKFSQEHPRSECYWVSDYEEIFLMRKGDPFTDMNFDQFVWTKADVSYPPLPVKQKTNTILDPNCPKYGKSINSDCPCHEKEVFGTYCSVQNFLAERLTTLLNRRKGLDEEIAEIEDALKELKKLYQFAKAGKEIN
jgi:hypothetical protein